MFAVWFGVSGAFLEHVPPLRGESGGVQMDTIAAAAAVAAVSGRERKRGEGRRLCGADFPREFTPNISRVINHLQMLIRRIKY